MPQHKKQVLQARGTKETGTSLAAVGSSGIAQQPAGEQGNGEHEQQDFIRHSERLRTFDEAMQRWYADICTPEYLLYHSPKESVWGYGIMYPLTDPPRVAPQKGIVYSSRILEGNEVGVEVKEKGDAYLHNLTFWAWRPKHPEFKDPYTGEQLADIKVYLQTSGAEDGRHFYVVSITERFYSHPEPGYDPLKWSGSKQRNLGYEVTGLRTGKPHLKIKKTFGQEGAELLSEPHALVLFNLMDTLIPHTTSITPHNEQPTVPEVPQTLPALPLRRPAG